MQLAYESPGSNALGWLAEKTLEPEILEITGKVNGFFDIPWSAMFVQMVQITTLGMCAMFILQVFGMKEAGKMALWLAAVECFAVVVRGITI